MMAGDDQDAAWEDEYGPEAAERWLRELVASRPPMSPEEWVARLDAAYPHVVAANALAAHYRKLYERQQAREEWRRTHEQRRRQRQERRHRRRRQRPTR
jgi:hypothetical protein